MKTRILNNKWGWYDCDVIPAIYYKTRREARKARRDRLGYKPRQTKSVAVTIYPSVVDRTSVNDRAFRRLRLLGVTRDTANSITKLTDWGYNRMVSYGHMLLAGATEYEATIIINFRDPQFSKRYGEARANGLTHYAAILEARHGQVSSLNSN